MAFFQAILLMWRALLKQPRDYGLCLGLPTSVTSPKANGFRVFQPRRAAVSSYAWLWPTMTSIAASTRASGKSGGVQSTTGKLNALADNFNHFYGDLEEETTVRKQAEEARVIRIERECGKIERVIGTETKRRIEASKALQAMFENQLVKIQKEFKEDLRETYEPLQEQIDALIGRVERLEKTMEVRFGSSSTP